MKKLSFWIFLCGLVALSLVPPAYLAAPVFSLWDKAQHALGFAVLTGLGLLAYPLSPRWRMALMLLVLGGAIELVQGATGWRYAEWSDWLADAIGIACAWYLVPQPVRQMAEPA